MLWIIGSMTLFLIASLVYCILIMGKRADDRMADLTIHPSAQPICPLPVSEIHSHETSNGVALFSTAQN